MKESLLIKFVFWLIVVLGPTYLYAQTSVLFAGNSYTYYNEMPSMVRQLADAQIKALKIDLSVNGGVSLQDHWEGNANLRTKKLLNQQVYDYVVLQDQSLTPIHSPEKTLIYGQKLAALVNKKGGQVVIFQTWSRKNNPDSQTQLDATFQKWSDQSGVKIAPVAKAWHLAMATYPDMELYDLDGSHPSVIGSYLTALIIYRTLFNEVASDGLGTFKSNQISMSAIKQCEWVANQVMK